MTDEQNIAHARSTLLAVGNATYIEIHQCYRFSRTGPVIVSGGGWDYSGESWSWNVVLIVPRDGDEGPADIQEFPGDTLEDCVMKAQAFFAGPRSLTERIAEAQEALSIA